MNWTRIKSIMIIFLLFINIFLVIVMGITTYRENNIPEEVVLASASILEKEGFPCDKDIIPDMYKTAPDLSAEFYSANELAEMFFGKQMAFRTEEDTLIAEAGDAKLLVSGNSFIYETKAKRAEASGRKLSDALRKTGISMHGAVYDKKNKCFYMMYKNANLFNMYIYANVNSDGKLCYVKAQWPKVHPAPVKTRVSFIDEISKLPQIFEKKGEIKSIEFGYSLVPMPGNTYVFKPSWRVKTENETQILL